MTVYEDGSGSEQYSRSARLARLPWLRTDTSTGHSVRFVADELLVRNAHYGIARNVLRRMGHADGAVARQEITSGFHRLRVTGMDVPATVRAIRERAGAAAVGANHVFLSAPYEHGGPFGPPMSLAMAGTLPSGPMASAAVRVAIVDTGVWRNSPLPRAWYEANDEDFDDTQDAAPDIAHANFIASVLFGATSNARVRIVKVLDATGVCTEADLASALLRLPEVDVVNLSLGGYTMDGQPPAALADALGTVLAGSDRVLVAAAGNAGNAGVPFWPAAFTTADVGWSHQVVAVAAHDGTRICDWSNTGPWVTLAAPGSDIVGTYVTSDTFTTGWARWSGSSFAVPYVIGAIAESVRTTGSVLTAAKNVVQEAAERDFAGLPGIA